MISCRYATVPECFSRPGGKMTNEIELKGLAA
jgi:hypothetical protein